MKDNQAKYPQLRFKGFTDPWEQRKLGDLGDILRKSIDPQLTPSREFVEYSMPSYDRGKRPNRVLGESMQSTRLKISGTVLLINKLNVRQRRIWFVKKAPENAVASGEFVPFQSFEIDLGFLHQLFLSDKTTSELQSISSGTSNSQKRVTPSDLLHYPICIPTTKGEQVVVGRFLSSIDNLITLHQRKLAKLKELKQGYLQKLFPRNGSKFPQLRFAGFADAWEQRKLGEIVEINSGRDYKKLGRGKIPVFGTGGYMLSVNGKLSDRDSVGIGRKGSIDKPQFLSAPFWTVDTLFFMTPKNKNDAKFIFDLSQLIQWKKYDESTGVPSLSKSTISNIPITVTKEDEQNKVSTLFELVDKIIAANQRKVEKLKELKKGYMQKMFCSLI